MPTYVQSDRSLAISTPLGQDALLLTGFTGREAISELFHYDLELLAENGTAVPFDALLGQFVVFRVALDAEGRTVRHFHGVCSRMAQGHRDEDFTTYRMEVVPALWFLTRRVQSRIFQHVSVPDILRTVFQGLDVDFQLQGTYYPRDYCAQYRESDFDFASRLMEEEGIFYFFRHDERKHTLVVADTPQAHPELAGGPSTLIFEEVIGGQRDEVRISAWRKLQELRSGLVTLWDHCFELPHKHLEAEKRIQEAAQVGTVEHKLKIGQNDRLEIYDCPGAYAQRFDGVDKQGGDRAGDIQRIFEDNKRTAEIRMQEVAAGSLIIRGESNARHLVSGHIFTLDRHYDGDGPYLLTGVQHDARAEGDYRSGGDLELRYTNTFTCIPASVPFRPERRTPRPVVTGPQTAVVVGPPGEEIFPDKYGRVKVQFHWDREHKLDLDSSCWVRVATPWAGKAWGMVHIPRVGQEVVIAFEHGDPDRPIIVGSVYNADMMPPYALPNNKTQSGIKSRSSPGGGPDNFNEIRFEDKKGAEQLYIHAEKDQSNVVENDDSQKVGRNRSITVGGTHTETITGDTKITIETGTFSHDVAKNTATYHVSKDITENYDANQKTNVAADLTIKVGTTGKSSGGVVLIQAVNKITIVTGESKLEMDKEGNITLSGKKIHVHGDDEVKLSSKKIEISGTEEVKAGVSTQQITCDKQKVNTSGAAINSSAVGMHEITGAVVKIN